MLLKSDLLRRFTVVLLFVCISVFDLSAQQDYWKRYTTNDGLVSQAFTTLLMESEQSYWIGTNFGLSHFQNGSFTNYTTVNSGLKDDDIHALAINGSKLYIAGDSGLSILENGAFIHFNTANGLIDNNINDLALDTAGTLWIASDGGLSQYDGSQFVHDATRPSKTIAIDQNGTIYSSRFTAIFQANLPQVDIYHAGAWTTYDGNQLLPNGPISITDAFFERMQNGEVILSTYDGGYFTTTVSPFSIQQQLPLADQVSYPTVFDVDIDSTNRRWIAARGNQVGALTFDSTAGYLVRDLGPKGLLFKAVEVIGNTVVMLSEDGMFVAPIDVPKFETTASLGANFVEAGIDVKGQIFHNRLFNESRFEHPKGTGKTSIYSAQLVVSTIDSMNGNLTVFPQSFFGENAAPGPVSPGFETYRDPIVKVSKVEINTHKVNWNQPNYSMPKGIRDWPANGRTNLNEPVELAPFVDVNANGCYDPENGDYPAIMGDQAVYFINNDADQELRPRSQSTGLEFHGMLFAYNRSPFPELNQVVFLRYEIVNRSTHYYDSVKAGFYVDWDLGNPQDDYVGCDSSSNIFYAYNGDANDDSFFGSPSYGTQPPAVGVKFITDSLDSFIAFASGNGQNGMVQNETHTQRALNGRWRNNDRMRYGGNGFNSFTAIGPVVKHQYTGNPKIPTGWTERTPGFGTPAHAPGDRRGMGSIPYFSLRPNERKVFGMVVGYGISSTGLNHWENVPEMVQVLNVAGQVYDTAAASFDQVASLASNPLCTGIITDIQEFEQAAPLEIEVFPNPSQGNFSIKSSAVIEQVELLDIRGAILQSYAVSNASLFQLAFPDQIPNGLYLLRIQETNGNLSTHKLMLSR